MTELIRYDAACRAIAEARSVDEVKEIRDVAAAMKAYARQAKNKTMEADAGEIRQRATRRIDQLRVAQKETVGLATGGDATKRARGIQNPEQKPTLAEAGIDKNLAKEARVLGAFSDEEFEEVVTETREAVIGAAKAVVKRRTKEANRETKLAKLGAAALPAGLFSIFNADPPWHTETWSDKGMDRAADNHYPTMSIEEIMALDVASIAARDSLLTLWATVPHLAQAIVKVLPAWGFEYRSMLTWDKEIIGNGKWLRNQTEHLIFATRGSFPVPPDKLKLSSLWRERRGKHSAKPVGILDWIDKVYPGVPKLELFRRGKPRPGWKAHGNEVEE